MYYNAPPSAIDYDLTFSFSGSPLPAGQLVLASMGLGGNTDTGPTIATVDQKGTFLGDYNISTPDFICGPTAFTDGPGSIFSLTNSLVDPTPGYFNSQWGVTRIDVSVSSLTIHVHHVGYDGIGFTIGLVGPHPIHMSANTFNGGLSINWPTNATPYTWQAQLSTDMVHWTTLSNTLPPIIINPIGPPALPVQFYRLICTNSP